MIPIVYDYTVYFEIYGKKMKVMVMATSETEAKEKVSKKIIFHKVEKAKSDFNTCMASFNDIFKNI